MKKLIYISLLLMLISSCKKNTYHVFSPDKKQCITIKDFYNERYIIIGKHYFLPDTNYVKLLTDPKVKMNDEFAGCWESDNSRLKIIINDSRVLENKLDTSKVLFLNHLPIEIDEVGKPSLKGFSDDGCFHFGFTYFSVVPKDGALIE